MTADWEKEILLKVRSINKLIWRLGRILILERNKVDSHAPADCLPVQADSTEFGGFGALVTIRRDDPRGDDLRINEGKNNVSQSRRQSEVGPGTHGAPP